MRPGKVAPSAGESVGMLGGLLFKFVGVMLTDM